MARSKKNRGNGDHSRRNRPARKGQAVKCERWWGGKSHRRNEASKGENVNVMTWQNG